MAMELPVTPNLDTSALHRRVVPLCHAIRWCAVAWGLWATVAVFMVYAVPDRVAENYGRALNVDLGQLPTSGYVLALAIISSTWHLPGLSSSSSGAFSATTSRATSSVTPQSRKCGAAAGLALP